MSTVLTKSELASRLGVTKARISHLLARGLPVRPDHKIDLDAALEWLKLNVVQQAGFQDRGIHKVLRDEVNVSAETKTKKSGISENVTTVTNPQRLRQQASSALAAPVPPAPGEPATDRAHEWAERSASVSPQPSTVDASDELDDDDSGALPYAQAKALRESYLARKAKLDFLKEQGKLLPVDVVEAKWSRIITGARNRLLACSSRIGVRIAHLTKVEVEAIDREIRSTLAELSDAPPC